MSYTNENVVVLSGNLCQKPRYREIDVDKKFASITLAVNRHARKNEDGSWTQKADFVPVEITNSKYAERFKDLPIGSSVSLRGTVESYSYEKDEKKIYGVRIHAVEIFSIIPKKENSDNDKKLEENNTPSIDISTDDLPF